MRGHVQRAPVVAEGDVGDGAAGFDASQTAAVGREHQYAAGAGGEHQAVGRNRQAIGQAGRIVAHEVRGVGELARAGHVAGRVERIGHPDRPPGVGVGDIQRVAVGREGDAVGLAQRAVEQVHAAVDIDAVDAVDRLFLDRRIVAILQAIGRIGEEHRAVAPCRHVIGTVETLAFVAVGQRGARLGGRVQARDQARARIGQQHAATGLGVKAIGAGLAQFLQRRPGVARGFQEHRQSIGLRPAVHPVLRHVVEQQVAAFAHPGRAFGPGELVAGELLHARVRIDHLGEGGRVGGELAHLLRGRGRLAGVGTRGAGAGAAGRRVLAGRAGGGQAEREGGGQQRRNRSHRHLLQGRGLHRGGCMPRRCAATAEPGRGCVRIIALHPVAMGGRAKLRAHPCRQAPATRWLPHHGSAARGPVPQLHGATRCMTC